ncbi:uncharacterized protein METZ01_LOCUS40746, partial [marine metagenome]
SVLSWPIREATPPPCHTQMSASDCDYGLQYKIVTKRIFTLFLKVRSWWCV